MSLLFGESGLLSFRVFALRHDGQSPLVLASEGGVLDRDGFEIVVGGVENEGGSSTISIYTGKRAWSDTTNLEVGVVVEVDPVSMLLGKGGKCRGGLELFGKSFL